MKPYKHTQFGFSLIAFLVAALVFFVWLAATTTYHPVFLLAIVLVIGLLIVFNSLTVAVESERVIIHFGPGWPRYNLPLNEIRDVCVVDHSPWDGWGIRLFQKGILYRISGVSAVELDLTEGRVLRIGTNEPQELARAIEDALLTRRKKPGV